MTPVPLKIYLINLPVSTVVRVINSFINMRMVEVVIICPPLPSYKMQAQAVALSLALTTIDATAMLPSDIALSVTAHNSCWVWTIRLRLHNAARIQPIVRRELTMAHKQQVFLQESRAWITAPTN